MQSNSIDTLFFIGSSILTDSPPLSVVSAGKTTSSPFHCAFPLMTGVPFPDTAGSDAKSHVVDGDT